MSDPNFTSPEGHMYGEYQPVDKSPNYTGHNFSFHYYISPYYLRHKDCTLPVPKPRRGAKLNMDLAQFLSPEIMENIQKAGEIVFHSVGDTGLVNDRKAVDNEEVITDAMSEDVRHGGENPPSFLFHLGDVVYYLGQRQYYYEQFYEPFGKYNRPIFAIPGNHDGSAAMKSIHGEKVPLGPFLENFCSPKPIHTHMAGTMARTTMTQPGTFFTLDAPFVSIIGLYTNCLEGPGIISTQKGEYPNVTDQQLKFLTNELKRLAPERRAGKRAIIVATHAPFYSSISGVSSEGMIKDLNACSEEAGIYPDALIAGHIHLYQRTTLRRPDGQEVPVIIAGSGGYNLETPAPKDVPEAGTTDGDLTTEVPYIREYGYMTIRTDAKKLTMEFKAPKSQGNKPLDKVTLDLITKKIIR